MFSRHHESCAWGAALHSLPPETGLTPTRTAHCVSVHGDTGNATSGENKQTVSSEKNITAVPEKPKKPGGV